MAEPDKAPARLNDDRNVVRAERERGAADADIRLVPVDDDRALDAVAQFADVAREVVAGEPVHRQRTDLLAALLRNC